MMIPDDDGLDRLLKRLHLAYIRRHWREVVARAEREEWSYRDFLPEGFPQTCPCYHEDPEWCILSDVLQPTGLLPAFLLWGQMGMIEHDLDPKSTKVAWDAWRAMPIE